MDEEQILNLFDVYWFYHKSDENPPSSSSSPPPTDPQPVQPETQIQVIQPPPNTISRLRSLHRRSLSDQVLSQSDPFSPNSVLSIPKLETILSGKEAGEITSPQKPQEPSKRTLGGRKKKMSRSLSELEFVELKGILDLGFTFSEAEVDSRLVSIVPGLQRLGKTGGEGENTGENTGENAVSRPYLSEAWSFNKKEEEPFKDWRIPAVGDGFDMKDQLKFWAHAVASTVR